MTVVCRFHRLLRATKYGQAIVLPRSMKAALVPFFARIPRRTGFRGEYRFGLLNDIRPFDDNRLDQTVKRFLELGLEPGEAAPTVIPTPHLRSDAARRDALSRQLGIPSGLPIVAIMPGAEYGPAKRWPVERFGELAQRLARRRCAIVLLGSAKEADIGAAIAAIADSPQVLNLCGKTALVDAVDILAAAAIALSNDSGLMHVAAALERPLVAIYGSSDPGFTPPLNEKNRVLCLGLKCSPCFQRECPEGHLDCLTGIGTDRVVGALRELVKEKI